MRKAGISTIGMKNLTAAGFEALKENGIEAVELSLSPSTLESYDKLNWKEIEKISEQIEVELWSVHLPFAPFEENNIASLDTEICKRTVKIQSEYIKKAADIGIKTAVIHPGGEPIADCDRETAMNHAKESLYELAKVCKSAGVVLAVEDLPRTCLGRNSKEILDLIRVDDSLTVCFDTNHLLKESIKDFVKAVGNRIRTLHVSDYDRIDERHWLPGEGVIDWKELMDLLDEEQYNNVFMYEVGYTNTKNITRKRDLTAADFYKNFCELHNREKLTVIK